jgi:hypothetical protein
MLKQPHEDRSLDKCDIANKNPSPNLGKTINISRLKDFAVNNFSSGHPLRIVLVDEDEVLSAEAFLAKTPISLKLGKLPDTRRS